MRAGIKVKGSKGRGGGTKGQRGEGEGQKVKEERDKVQNASIKGCSKKYS